jgi:hypothetical protein
MDESLEIDDSEVSDSGSISFSPRLWKCHVEETGQAASGKVGCVLGGRINDEGQQMVLDFFEARKMSDVSEMFLGSLAATTLRNYRRGFTLFSRMTKEIGVDCRSIDSSQRAIAVLVKVVKQAFRSKIKLAAVNNMRTAMIRVFSFAFDCNLSESMLVKTAMKFYTVSDLPKKEPLRLNWSIEDVFRYIISLPKFEDMEFDQLTSVTLVLCLAFTTLRFTELARVNVFETEPDFSLGTWKLWVRVKGHNCKEPVTLHVVEIRGLDPVSALWELRSRLKDQKQGCWFADRDGKLLPLSYNEIRSSALRVLSAAGVRDTHPYHIKHAVLSCLNQSGSSMSDIAAFARHRFGSMAAYEHYISYDGGKSSVNTLIKAFKSDDGINVTRPN